jgi:Asp-tRNA(Asn)/Glu-tRNA(Gln) amidotransferase A subunit family amidase
MPEYLQHRNPDGSLAFAVPGFDVTSRDYIVRAAAGEAPISPDINLRSINNGPASAGFAFDLARYLLQRGDARVVDWRSLNANATYYSEQRAAAMKNWEHMRDLASEGMSHNIKVREVMRLVVQKVLRQNRLAVFVNPTTTLPPAKIGHATQPTVNDRPAGRFPTSANLGIPEITVPAGFNRVVYEPGFVLNRLKTAYESEASEREPTTLDSPHPVGISFWAGPGDEALVLAIALAYEEATRHRTPPPAFGPVARQTRTRQR